MNEVNEKKNEWNANNVHLSDVTSHLYIRMCDIHTQFKYGSDDDDDNDIIDEAKTKDKRIDTGIKRAC